MSRVVLVATSDRHYDKYFPFQAGQMHPLRYYRRPPFRIDGAFRSALQEVSKKCSPSEFSRFFDYGGIGQPSSKLLRMLNEAYLGR